VPAAALSGNGGPGAAATITYSPTRDARIDDCSDDWDARAASEGGDAARAALVIGRGIWDVVRRLEARAYLNALFFACRQTNQPIDVAYRCNWACGSQLCRMEIRSLGRGALEISHRAITPVETAPHAVLRLNDHRPTIQCSQGLRVLIGKVWVDVLRPLHDCDLPLHPVVCPACRQASPAQIAAFPRVPPGEG
jgi:hypothetical protein